jgi:hypothetical protein
VLASGVARADEVALLSVTVGGQGPSASALAAATQALGGEALAPSALRQRAAAAFGPSAPTEDPLAASRREIDSAIELYFARGPAQALPRLRRALAALDAAPDALASVEANRVAWLRAMTTLARIDAERRDAAAADQTLRRVVAFAPGWQPDPREFPPAVTDRHRALAAEAHGTRATLDLWAPEGCRLELDGAAVASNPAVGVSTFAGDHVVLARCGGDLSRVHRVHLAADARGALRVDPALDRALVLAPEVALRVDDGAAFERRAGDFARALATALGVERVLFALEGQVRVYDGVAGRLLGTVDASQLDHLAGVLHPPAAPSTSAATAERPMPDPGVRTSTPSEVAPGPRNPWPWVLLGVGGAALATSGVAYYLRTQEQATLDPQCSDTGEQRVCPDSARDLVARIGTLDTLAGVTLGVGAALVVGGVLWALAAPRRSPPVSIALDASGRGLSLVGAF